VTARAARRLVGALNDALGRIETGIRALKRFWRADRSASSGGGLGLAIASRIAEAHDGRLEIEDAPGGGALIRMRFD